jgi:predicted Zn finger-like uncharacterized protein
MSVVTRCPGCGTAFRVTDAQLQARAGRVRCGRCGNAFDARVGLVPRGVPSASTEVPAEIDFGPRPHRRPSRWWWPAAVVALVALGLQLGFYFRGEVAVRWPAAKPLLTRACAEIGCDIPLPHHPELMSIEASDLQADPSTPGVMVLTATLRNRAAFPQQFPALELTLTNSQEEAVARRVLTGRDYLGRGVNLQGGFAPNSELAIKVFFDAAALKPTGYRLYLFYP